MGAKFGCEPQGDFTRASGSRLQDHRLLWVVGGLASEVFNFALVLISEVIKAEAVFLVVHNGAKLCLKQFALGGVKQALKDGVLHALSVVNALFGDLPQALSTGGVLGI